MGINLNWKYVFTAIIIIGIVFPFIDYLTIIEMFFLLIPFGIIVIASLIYWFVSIFNEKLNSKNAFYFFLIVPVFILSQLFSGFMVDKIQLFRSDRIIAEIEKQHKTTNEYPEQYDISLGITYELLDNGDRFKISYSRGFMVTEKYYSDIKNWKSYGWND